MCREALDLERGNVGERTKCTKDKDHDLWYGPGPLQSSDEFHVLSVALEWAGTESSAMAANTGCTRNAVGSIKCLAKDPDDRCIQCQGSVRPLDSRPLREVQVGPDKLEAVASFCYLGDMPSAADGCELSTTTRVKTAWKKFKELLLVLSFRYLSFKTHGHVYRCCV